MIWRVLTLAAAALSTSGIESQTSSVSAGSALYAQLLTNQSATGRSLIFVNVRNLGITNHQFEYTVSGSPTTCTLLVESSLDAVSWTTQATQNCATGSSVAITGTFMYLTVNLSALSGGINPNISVNYRGYLAGQGYPVRTAEGGTGTTTTFTQGSVVFAGSSGIYGQDNSNFFWDDANNRLCLLSNSCTNTLDIGGAKFYVTSGGAMTSYESTARASIANNVASIVDGAPSQTADLHRWRSSGGTVLASISKAGTVRGHRLDNNVPLSGVVKADYTVASVANTTTETSLNSYSIPAATLEVNRALLIKATGVYGTANATDTITLRMKVGGATWHTIVSTPASVTNAQWSVEWLIIVATTGAGGAAESQLPGAFINSVFKSDPNTATESIDTTTSRTLEITAQWSAAASANTISIRQFVVEVHN